MPRKRGRANGEGSIYEYPKGSGSWFAQIWLGEGKSIRRSAKTQREAREKLKKLQAEFEQGVNLTAKQPTVSEWCTTWLDTFAPNLKPNVREDYEGVIKRYIDGDTIGKRRLDKLTPTEVQAWVNRLTIRVAPQTVRNAHTRLHKALEVAVKNNYVPRNVASSTELPSVPKTDIQPLNSEQVQKLLDTVEGHRWAALYRLAVNLGMREAELFGLTWPAIDFERRAARHRLEDPRSLLTGCDRPDLRSRPRRVQVRRYRRTVAEAAKTAPPRYSVYYSVGPRNGLALP